MRIRHVALVDVLSERVRDDQQILVQDGVIVECGDDLDRDIGPEDLDGRGLFALAGLIDCHVHVASVHVDEWMDSGLSASYVAAHAFLRLEASLRRGFTTLRDAGGADYGLVDALDEGLVVGPRLFVCGKALSPTGGHADLRPRGREQWDPHPQTPGIGVVVDGVEEIRRAVRQQVRRGASFIKLMVSGGITSPTDRIDQLQFSDSEIAAAVDEAARLGVYCAGHAYTSEAVLRAARLGVRTIEHGSLIDRKTADELRRLGAIYVGTLSAYQALEREGAELGLSDEGVEKVSAVRAGALASLAAAEAAGATIAFGSDLLAGLHVYQGEEFQLRAQVQPAWSILRSATLVGAEVVGMSGRLGVLQEGALADILLFRADPSQDITIIGQPQTFLAHVISRGRCVGMSRVPWSSC